MLEKIKNFYGSHPIRWTLLTLVVIIGLALLIWYAPAFSMRADECALEAPAKSDVGEEIPVVYDYREKKRSAEPMVVAEAAGRTLTLDPVEMIFTLADENGTTWTSAMAGSTLTGEDKALLILEYVGENNTFYKLNSYDAGTLLFEEIKEPVLNEDGTELSKTTNIYYDHIYRIENGVRLEMRVLDNTRDFFAYMPQKMPKTTFDFFNARIAELREQGVAVNSNAFEGYYNNADPKDPNTIPLQGAGSPPTAAANQIMDLAIQVGYNHEMLVADCSKYGATPASPELADFNLVLEITLDENGELIARIPTDEILNHNTYFRLQRIHVLPNLCAVSDSTAQGYYLVPDGAGALVSFNFANTAIPTIIRPYMNNDVISDYYWQTEYGEELMMPIYGVIYGGAQSTHGMLAIIEEGAETANLHVASTTSKNKAYVSVDTLEHSWVRIYGAYADNTASYLADSGHIETDFTLRFIPYAEPVTYFDMAMDYRDYLQQTSGKTYQTPEGPNLFLELLGAVTLTERFVGVPYDAINSMTTYADALAIVESLQGHGVNYQYDGAFNGGVLSGLNDGADLVKENGSEAELAQLLSAAEANGSDFFLQMNMSRVYDNGRNYIPYMHAMRDYSNSAMTVYLHRADTAQMNGRWDPIQEYTIVSPRYFGYLSERIKADLNASEVLSGADIAIGDLAHDVYADYRFNNVINPVEARTYVRAALSNLAAGDTTLAFDNPFADVAAMSDYAVNVSRHSSDYGSYYATIPFRQLALTGLTNVVSTDVNLSSRDLDHFLLAAAELGTSVKYTVCAQNPDVLKNSHFEAMYAIHWDAWQEEILEAATQCDALRAAIGGRDITNHELLAPQVFRTTYAGDVVVITNYSALPFESTEGTIAPGSYWLSTAVQEGGAQ